MTPTERAKRSAEALWANDRASPWVGISPPIVDEGRAEMRLTVQEHHCNGHGICHGGVIFTLADSAFAFACNSRNQATVAQHNTISFIAPARQGDELIAQAQEISLAGRSGITDVTVRTKEGTIIAQFRGASRAIKGQNFDESSGT